MDLPTPSFHMQASPDQVSKILAVEFYKAISRSLVRAGENYEDKKENEKALRNYWILLWTFWAAIRNSSRIKSSISHEINELLLTPPKKLIEAQEYLYLVFDAAADAGIFVDFNQMIDDYAPL